MRETSKKTRKRTNFTMKVDVLRELEILVPSGERSDFVNTALEEALVRFSKKKAGEMTDRLREQLNLKIGCDEELLKKIRYGRK